MVYFYYYIMHYVFLGCFTFKKLNSVYELEKVNCKMQISKLKNSDSDLSTQKRGGKRFDIH